MDEDRVDPETRARLRRRGIEIMGETKGHLMVVRGACMALVELTSTGLGSIGSTGMMTASGLAFLVRREGKAYLSAKGSQIEAEEAQVEAILAFSDDLKTALE